MLVAFQDPEIQLAHDQSFLKSRPPTYSAQNYTTNPWEDFFDSCTGFINKAWLYDGLYLVSIACPWPKDSTVEGSQTYKRRLMDMTQTSADNKQTNARQTVSSVWVGVTSRCVQMLDVQRLLGCTIVVTWDLDQISRTLREGHSCKPLGKHTVYVCTQFLEWKWWLWGIQR